MLKRMGLIIVTLAMLLGMALKSYSANRFDEDIVVQTDGSLRVTETIDFAFAGGPFTFVFRKLPTDFTDGITDIRASLDGVALPQGKDAGQVEIANGNPIEVTWHFAPTTDATRRFVLSYHALGVVRQENGADALYWGALPDQYEYPITSSTIRVTYPTNAQVIGVPGLKVGAGQVEQGESFIAFSAHNLQPNSPLVLAIRFKGGSLISTPPQWQAREIRSGELAPIFASIAIAVFLIGLMALLVVWLRNRREIPQTAGAFRVPSPPNDLSPAVAGALNGSGPAWSNALATLFDLAQRGVISIDETPGSGWFRQRDFIITQLTEPAGLKPHEIGLLQMLFDTRNGRRPDVKLSQVSQGLGSQWKKFEAALKQEMKGAGFYSPERQAFKRQLNIAATLLVGLGIAGFIASIILANGVGGWVVLIPLAVIGVATAGYVVAAISSPLSDEGAREAARWQGFYEYLRDIARGREAVTRPDLFERYLPYAASYGMAEAWAKFFRKQGRAEIPAWFHALAGANGDGMGAFVAMTVATSSAGSSGGGAAGAGAAGGGASGAG